MSSVLEFASVLHASSPNEPGGSESIGKAISVSERRTNIRRDLISMLNAMERLSGSTNRHTKLPASKLDTGTFKYYFAGWPSHLQFQRSNFWDEEQCSKIESALPMLQVKCHTGAVSSTIVLQVFGLMIWICL